ncbi:hypothetical protein NY08_369 [Rhodococcus sp. B7740]|nr:hypothetical protein NY08_369 [Rhodococcus sp. B7740]
MEHEYTVHAQPFSRHFLLPNGEHLASSRSRSTIGGSMRSVTGEISTSP